MPDHFSMCSYGAISASTFNLRLPNWDEELFVHDFGGSFEFNTIHHFILKNNYWVVVSDRRFYETSAIFNVPRTYDFKTRDLRVPRSKALSVLRTDRRANTIDASEYDWAGDVTT